MDTGDRHYTFVKAIFSADERLIGVAMAAPTSNRRHWISISLFDVMSRHGWQHACSMSRHVCSVSRHVSITSMYANIIIITPNAIHTLTCRSVHCSPRCNAPLPHPALHSVRLGDPTRGRSYLTWIAAHHYTAVCVNSYNVSID